MASLLVFLFFFFVIKSLLCLKVQRTHAALAMEIKNLQANFIPPASPRHKKNQTPRDHRRNLPSLAPKTRTSDT